MISLETENKLLWLFVALAVLFVIFQVIDYIQDSRRLKKIDDQRYKEHKEIIDLIYFVKNELLTRHVEK